MPAGRVLQTIGVLPAHAGMIRNLPMFSAVLFRAPRSRGDDPSPQITAVLVGVCSPLTRG